MFEQADSSNHDQTYRKQRLPLSATFTAKFELPFAVTLKKALFWRFHFTANRNSIGSSKNGAGDLKSGPPFERSVYFLCGNQWKF